MAKITFKGTPIHTNAELPKIGAKAPNFSLVDSALADKTLGDFKGKRKIIYMVPSLDTSVCSASSKKFNEKIASHSDIVMIVISADLPFAQGRVCGAENMKNLQTLSMMRSKQFATDYGVAITDGPLAGLCARAVVVLDKDDKVLYSELVSEIASEPNYEKALAAAFS